MLVSGERPVYLYIVYLEPICPLFWGLNPPKQALFQSKQWSFGFQVYTFVLDGGFKYFVSFHLYLVEDFKPS